MRKIIITACFISALFQIQTFAQFSIAVNAGLAGLKYKIKEGQSKIKPGLGFDLGFTRKFSKHWGFVSGMGVMQYNTDAFMNNSSEASENQVDDMGAGFKYTVKTTGYKETQNFTAVTIPLMLQYRTANAEKTQWFFNTGAKLILPFDTKIKAAAQRLDLSGYYPDFNLQINDLPQHGFGNVNNWSSDSKTTIQPEIALSALTGISFNLKNSYRLSIAVYCDYGMSGMKKTTDQPLVTYSTPINSGVVANSVLEINNTGFVRSLNTGIQFKLDFGKKKLKVIQPEMVDWDKDGITDSLDLCPYKPGSPAFKGCPDTDGDGIPDNLDNCPDVKGLQKYKGCPIPDRDKDGINDEEDKCPDLPGIAAYQGCPPPEKDSDNDGIADAFDKCPSIAGVAENQGCPVIEKEVIMQTNLAAQNILFTTGTAKLIGRSFDGLNDVAKIMRKTRGLHIYIDGHTDNVGTDDLNQTLSEARARTVQLYFKNQGLTIARLHAAGFGKLRPIADNKTAAGRRQNRRVELRLSY